MNDERKTLPALSPSYRGDNISSFIVHRSSFIVSPRAGGVFVVFCILALLLGAVTPAVAPDSEFASIQTAVEKDAPSQDLVDRLYAFMEKYADDPRADRVQFWVGITQQRRKFHNEAVKELQFVVTDFPSSPLVLPALAAEATSFRAMDKEAAALDCERQIADRRPKDWNDQATVRCYHDALCRLADAAMRGDKPDVDAATALLMQLPDQQEAISRCVQLYAAVGRMDDALKAIGRLPDSQRMLGYRLMAEAYGTRPGTENLYNLLDEVLGKEKPSDAVDDLVRNIARIIASKGEDDHRKVLKILVEKDDRLKRWAEFGLCEMDRSSDVDRLIKFVADYNTGPDVEQTKVWIGEFYEAAGKPDAAREAYQRLNDAVGAHFRVAETYYGPRAKTKDLPGGQAELSAIVKRFYSPGASAEALWRRAALEHDQMQNTDAAKATLLELVDRFGHEDGYGTRALMRLGELWREQKKPDEAIKVYEKLIADYPGNPAVPQAWLEIGYCDEEAGRPQQAIEVFKSVLRKFARTHEASVAHSRLETKYGVEDLDVSDR
jgi:TolA-binding protein